MRFSALLCLLPLTVWAGLSACSNSTEAQEPATMPGALTRHEPTRVRVLPVVRREMRRTLETTTVVESERHVVINPRTQGLVTELFAEEGDEVEKGEVLARLDSRDAQAQLDDARIALQEAQDALANGEIAKREATGNIDKCRLAFEQAKRNYERNEKAKLISAQDLEQLKLSMDTADQELEAVILAKDRTEIEARAAVTAVDRARLTVQRAEVTLSYTELRAPFAGMIAYRTIQVGDNVTGAEPAFTITDLGDLRTVFYRPQRELSLFTGKGPSHLNGNQGKGFTDIEVTATAEALPGCLFTGHIERISPDIDATSGSFRVTVRLDEESNGQRLLPGMLLRLMLVTERHPEALAVSKRALRREGDTTILFIAIDGKAERIAVEEGFSDDDFVEITPLGKVDLAAGAEVIVVGNRDLEDGKEIEITPWDDDVEESEANEAEAPAEKPGEAAAEEPVKSVAEEPTAPVEEPPVPDEGPPAEKPAENPAKEPPPPGEEQGSESQGV